MYHDMFFVVPLLFLRPVSGIASLSDSVHDKPNEAGTFPLLSTSPVSSLAPPTSDFHLSSSLFASTASRSDRPLALVASATPLSQLAHHLTVPHVVPSATTNTQATPVSIVSEASFATHPSLSTSLHTEGLPSQQHHPLSPSSAAFESTDFAIAQASASSSTSATTSTSATSKIRFVLIGVLAGVPVLTMLGFFITIRWRRIRQARRLGMKKTPSDCDRGFNIKEMKGTRFSSFFSVNTTGVVPGKEKDGRNICRLVYASSIHSTAGLAGVGAHRGASANLAPPMIHYINVAETGLDGELEKKANFDNPFGTPPHVCASFITAPSRVLPHLPQTPPQLINLPPQPTATHRGHAGQFGNTGPAISHPIAILSQHSAPRQQSHCRNRGRNEQCLEEVKDPLPAHVRSRAPPSSPRLLSPDVANHIRSHTRNHKHPISPDSQHNATLDVRISIATSVYGGITSPSALPFKERSPDSSPVLSYLAPSPNLEKTPVLPYLSSPVSSAEHPKEQRQGAGPMIVIEGASPTIESESEYMDIDSGHEPALCADEEVVYARRTGLIGTPHGFVAPSSTFSSVSSYSISGSRMDTSSSTSTIIPYESSTSSALALSLSSSDDSSVTVTAAMVDSVHKIRMGHPDAEGSRHANQPVVSWSLPRDFDKLDREGARGIAF